jgi:polysaccharide pyruvyl transferase WcaK-like protein
MKILIEQSGHHLKNMGDLAMLQVAISRLQGFWSNSEIHVITTDPILLEKYCPGTYPFSPSGRNIWNFKEHFKNKFANKLAFYFYRFGLDNNLRKLSPYLMKSLIQYIFLLRNRQQLLSEFRAFNDVLFNADLVIATGGGYMNDLFHMANNVLNTLQLAVTLQKKTAIFGNGLGPLRDSKTLLKAKCTLPAIDVIGLRENRVGPSLLKSFGVASERVIVTGDDAIELSYQARKDVLGDGIGVNLRIASYSDVSFDAIESVRKSLHSIARFYDIKLIPVPIARYSAPAPKFEEPDSVSIKKLIEGFTDQSDGGLHLDTPEKVIENVSLCRVVVTGSYHAGVFALSQGIPVVALAKSEYYVDKFLGLAVQFGIGCEVVFLNDKNLEETLTSTIQKLWSQAEDLRPKLLESAKSQIELSLSAYKRVYDLVNKTRRQF